MLVQGNIDITTQGRKMHELTSEVDQWLESSDVTRGICQLFLQHTSASLLLCENADPDVQRDLEAFAQRLVPDGDPLFQHTMEGPDDMPAHVKSSMIGVSLTLPISDGQLRLGTWQGIYLCEHRNSGGARRIVATINGQSTGTTHRD